MKSSSRVQIRIRASPIIFLETCRMLLLSVAIIFALQFRIEDTNFDTCDDGSLKFESLRIGNVKAGEEVTLDGKGEFTKKITSGKVHTQILFGIIPIINRQDDLCSSVEQIDLHCPLEGKKDIRKSFAVPKEIPPGNYVVRIDAVDQDNEKVTCISGKVEVQK